MGGKAMIRFEVQHDGSDRWRLVNRTPCGADVLAHEASGTDRLAWREAVERLRQGRGHLIVSATTGGHFRWVLRTADGAVIAESPAVHRNADLCRLAFADARRAARTAFGGPGQPL